MDDKVQKVEIVKEIIVRQAPSEVPAYATVFGIFALITAIVSFLIPIIGPLFITPFAVICGIIALFGGSRGMGIATTIIVTINLIISPSFWLSFYTGTAQAGTNSNSIWGMVLIICTVLLYVALIISRKTKAR
jgi:hypothetical protein